MFVIIYQTEKTFDAKMVAGEVTFVAKGDWQVDTDEDGKVSTYDDLKTALDRVEYIRNKGGEACLACIIE